MWKGNGLFIWQVKQSTGLFPANSQDGWDYLANVLENTGVQMAPVKAADGIYDFNQIRKILGWSDDILPGLYPTIEGAMLSKMGWQYVYGYNPKGEANAAIRRIKQYGLTHWIIDAEGEYKTSGSGNAEVYMSMLTESCPDVQYALCSYRFPKLHPEFPWKAFLKYLDPDKDCHMPQVYWQASYGEYDGAAQLRTSREQLLALKELPIVPVGPCYGAGDGNKYWSPSIDQMDRFVEEAIKLKCPGILWWELGNMLRPDFIDRGYLGRMKKYSDMFGGIVPPVVPDAEKLQRLWNAHPELH